MIGYGGGAFGRTLAAQSARQMMIGIRQRRVATQSSHLQTPDITTESIMTRAKQRLDHGA